VEQGDAAGIAALVTDYSKGRGVPQNYVQAVKWYRTGVRLGTIRHSAEFYKELRTRAGEHAVAEGEALAGEGLAKFQASHGQ